MSHVIIICDDNTHIHKIYPKTVDELYREVQLGTFESPVALRNPTAVKLQNYLLVAEKEQPPMLSHNQLQILELLSLGASETEIGRALHLSYGGVRHSVDALKKKYNVTTREELITIYCRSFRR